MQSKFTKEERLEIGREIYEGLISREEAAVTYDIGPYTARDYFRMYKATVNVSNKKAQKKDQTE